MTTPKTTTMCNLHYGQSYRAADRTKCGKWRWITLHIKRYDESSRFMLLVSVQQTQNFFPFGIQPIICFDIARASIFWCTLKYVFCWKISWILLHLEEMEKLLNTTNYKAILLTFIYLLFTLIFLFVKLPHSSNALKLMETETE